MNKLTRTVFVVLIVFVTIHPVYAGTPEDTRGIISVTGRSSGSYSPDTVQINIGVETLNRNLDTAVKENSEKVQAVLKAIRDVLKNGEGDVIGTSQYVVEPVYEYRKSTRVFKGYKIVNQVSVSTRQIQKLGILIDQALKNGANIAENIVFSLEKTDEVCDGLIKEAITKSRARTDLVARSMNVKITGIKSVSPQCDQEGSFFPGEVESEKRFKLKPSDTFSPAPPIEPGKINLDASVSMEFFIE